MMNAISAIPADRPRRRVVLADDHLVVAQGIERLLSECFDVISLVFDGNELLATLQHDAPDLVIADVSMPGLSGIDAMHQARRLGASTPFIFLTMHADSELAARAICEGASGYVLKSSAGDELVHAVREVLDGKTYITQELAASAIAISQRRRRHLTEKQQQILEYVAKGLKSKQIAYELGLSVRTVESHKYTLMQEFGVHGAMELIHRAQREGLLPGFARAG